MWRAQQIGVKLVRKRDIAGEMPFAAQQPVILAPAYCLAYAEACRSGCDTLVHCLASR